MSFWRLLRAALLGTGFIATLVVLSVGVAQQRMMSESATAGGVLLATSLFGFLSRPRRTKKLATTKIDSPAAITEASRQLENLSSTDDEASQLAHQMLEQHRFALLLRPQIAASLSDSQLTQARQELEKQMSLVPTGSVVIRPWHCGFSEEDEPTQELRVVQVASFYLDRYPVTNRQFFEFVAAGGYEQSGLWDQEVWSGASEYLDQTGQSGPRFWRNGHYAIGEDEHPVVGICWYEAAAYARWVGKRLPTDAEWVKAASWPVPQPDSLPTQRKYPWGETADHKLANLWGSGPERTVAVHEFSGGATVGGAHQMIGNVWEWTASNLTVCTPRDQALDLTVPLKSIRGGAFDTYLASQANTEFQSGEALLSRRHNIGFRVAIGVCDVASSPEANESSRGIGFQPVDFSSEPDRLEACPT